jgi:DNA-binding response OmpR family regulator
MNNKKIVICDDDEGILDMLEMILEDTGYNIIPEKNSLNIYNIIKKEHPDLLLLDLWMPVLSGDQVLRALKNNPNTCKLPVIIISASTEGKKIAAEAGADEFIAKPFDVNQLMHKVKEILE